MKKKSSAKKNVVKKKKREKRCVCCGSRKEDFERSVEQILFASLKRLALAMQNSKERETFIALLEVGLGRLLEIDKKPSVVDQNRA